MAGGSLGLPSSNFSDKTEKDDESVKSDFANAREEPNGYYPTHMSSLVEYIPLCSFLN